MRPLLAVFAALVTVAVAPAALAHAPEPVGAPTPAACQVFYGPIEQLALACPIDRPPLPCVGFPSCGGGTPGKNPISDPPKPPLCGPEQGREAWLQGVCSPRPTEATSSCLPLIGSERRFYDGANGFGLYGRVDGACAAGLAEHAELLMYPRDPMLAGDTFPPFGSPWIRPTSGPSRSVAWHQPADRPRVYQWVWGDGAVVSPLISVWVQSSPFLRRLRHGLLEAQISGDLKPGATGSLQRLRPEGWRTSRQVALASGSVRFRVRADSQAAVRLVVGSAALTNGWIGGASNPVAP